MRIFNLLACISFAGACVFTGSAVLAATPDQVLVLYNADYTVDQAESAPGQDSKEVADYYVTRHTDPVTGKKPYELGLSCVHGKNHLAAFRLPEDSQDNYFGLEYAGKEDPPEKYPVYDSRIVDITIPKAEAEKLDLKSVVIAVGKSAEREQAQVIYADGAPASVATVQHTSENGNETWKFSPYGVTPGIVHVWFEAKDKDGKPAKNLAFTCRDAGNFKVTTTGPDGIRDDQNYLQDIEQPVKKFLEDPANALPDGTLLKDHILYIVVCHGLPKGVQSLYGICRGCNENLWDYGDGSSLEMRLAVLYYDVTTMDFMYEPTTDGMKARFLPGGFAARFSPYLRMMRRDNDGVQRQMICNTLAYQLLAQFNPYVNPKTFRMSAKKPLPDIHNQERYADPNDRLEPLYDEGQKMPPHFSTELRKTWPRQNFLYAVSRIDAPTPQVAKAQIDSAIYGTRYFTQKMGTCYNKLAGPLPIQPSVRLGIDELKDLGFTLQPKLSDPPQVVERPLIFSAHFGNGPKYYDEGGIVGWNGVLPGGIIYAIKSSNSWRRNDQQFGTYFQKMVEAGATITAGLGCPGGGHITSASWWDDRILFHHLFRGYQFGECLLMSTFYLDWVTGYVGDPLYCPNVLVNQQDTTSPVIDGDIKVEVLPARNSYFAVVSVPLQQTDENPEMAEISASCSAPGTADVTAHNWRFLADPQVIVTGLKPGTSYSCALTITDPYGNAAEKTVSIPVPAGAPAHIRQEETITDGKATPIAIAKYREADDPPAIVSDAGEIEIDFTPHTEKFTILDLQNFSWTSENLHVGGATAMMHEPFKYEIGKRYKAIARWRRYPLTREVYIVDQDGVEHLAAQNNCVAWPFGPDGDPTAISGTTKFGDRDGSISIHSVKIFDAAAPAPHEHREPYPKKFSF